MTHVKTPHDLTTDRTNKYDDDDDIGFCGHIETRSNIKDCLNCNPLLL